MARQPRFTVPGIPQHIIQRGNNREPCFYTEENYCRYQHDLIDAAQINLVIIHADALNQQLVLGQDDFKDKIEEMTNRQTRPKPLGRHRIEEDY